jgi:hypothetical protein
MMVFMFAKFFIFIFMHEKFMDLEFRSAKIHGSGNSQCSTTESTQPETEKKKVLWIQKNDLLNHSNEPKVIWRAQDNLPFG